MRTGQKWMDRIGGGHNVQISQGFRKPAVFYQQNKDPKYLEIADSNWDALYAQYGQVPGGMFGGDEFARPGYGDPKQAIETCGAVEMMFSQQILFRITGDLKWMDRCENVAFNTFPATMTADYKALRYLTSPNQCNSDARSKAPSLANDGEMQVMNPRDHRCCQHNVGVGWPHFIESLYAATPDRGLAAVMYAPCVVSAQVGDGTKVTIEQVTKYPFEESVQLNFRMPKDVAFPLYLRIPAWCDTPGLSLNGEPAKLAAEWRPIGQDRPHLAAGRPTHPRAAHEAQGDPLGEEPEQRLHPSRPAHLFHQDRREVCATWQPGSACALAGLGDRSHDALELRPGGGSGQAGADDQGGQEELARGRPTVPRRVRADRVGGQRQDHSQLG